MILLTGIILLIKILDFIYLFQIKEYRFDRFRSMLFEEGILKVFYLRKPRLPAKSVRNMLLTLLSAIATILFFWLQLAFFNSFQQNIVVVFVSPVIALSLVVCSVIVTKPLAYLKRLNLITQAKQKINRSKAQCIGISGTYGKTSTKELLYQMLSTKFPVAKTDDNMNTDVGVAISILKNLQESTRYFIAEVGGYKRGEVRRASEIFWPHFAVITAFGNQHLDLYGSRENLVATESEILPLLPKDGIAYINKDLPEFNEITKSLRCTVRTFSTSDGSSDISIRRIKESDDGLSITATVVLKQKEQLEIETHLIGRHNVINLLPCIGLCLDLGMKKQEILSAIAGLKQVKGRLSLHKGFMATTVLNDASNSSVEGFIAAIQTAERFPHTKKLMISKGIIELGKEKETSYNQVINALQETSLQLLTTDALFKKLDHKNQVEIFADEAAILKNLLESSDSNTLLVIEGKFTKRFVEKVILL